MKRRVCTRCHRELFTPAFYTRSSVCKDCLRVVYQEKKKEEKKAIELFVGAYLTHPQLSHITISRGLAETICNILLKSTTNKEKASS